MELKHYLVILRRWGWIMILCTVLASAASYWFSSRQPRVYESVSRYLVGTAVDNPNVNSNDLRASSQAGQTYAALAESRPVLQSVADKLKLNIDPSVLASNVVASWSDTNLVLTIRVHAADPNFAANVANAVGDALIERSPGGPASLQASRRQAALTQIAKLQETIRATEAEIDQLTNQVQQTTDQVSQRALIVRLDQRRAQLATAQRALTDQYSLVQNSGTNQIAVMEQAVPNPVPIAPEVTRNVLAALIAGLVLGLAAMLLFEYFTDVIYTPEELRKATGLPYLGGIARRKRLRGVSGPQIVVHARPEALAAESYRMLRTNLQMAGPDLHLPSVLITSPSRGDGKSEIAANLAASMAQAGRQVILVDANLRRPRIAALFGLPGEQGLSGLLDQPGALIEPLPVEAIPGLSVVPAGLPAPNSSDIVSSQRMYRLIQELKARADIVIVDSPPLLYSDALALALLVDGVLLVGNSGTTGRESMINAVENLRLVDAHLLGAVLNRVKAGPAYSYYPSRLGKGSILALPSAPSRPALAAPAAPSEPAETAPVLDEAVYPSEPAAPAGEGAGDPAPVGGEVVALPVEPFSDLSFEPAHAPGATTVVETVALPVQDAIDPAAEQPAQDAADPAPDLSREVGALAGDDEAQLVEATAEVVDTGSAPVAVHANGRRPPQDEGNRPRNSRRNRGRN